MSVFGSLGSGWILVRAILKGIWRSSYRSARLGLIKVAEKSRPKWTVLFLFDSLSTKRPTSETLENSVYDIK